MTIGIEATKAYEREKTGVGWYAFYIIQGLMEALQPPHELRLYVNPRANVKAQMSNVKSLRWPFKYLWTQGRLSLEMITNPPDALFIPAHLPPLYHPKKLVATIHDLAFKQYPEVYSAKERILQEWGIRRVLKHAWRIIAPSEFTKSEIQKYYPRLAKDNIFVVPHGVEKFQNSKLKTQNHNLKLKTAIVYIGRLERKKNIVNLVKAFNIVKNWKLEIGNWKLVLIGPLGYGYEQIKEEIDASPHKSDIHELGWLGRETVVEHLQNAALFVFPSLYEGFGMPLLEAFASGAPVVCSDIPVFHEVGSDIPLYANPHNPQSIADAMRTMLVNETLRERKIEEGFYHAKKCNWREAAKKTLEILTNP